MNKRNVTILAVVAILALGVGLVVYGILTAPKKAVPPPRSVVVATMNIPLHAHVVPSMLTIVQKPADQVAPDVLADPSQALGQVAMAPIPEGSAISAGQLAKPPTPEPNLLTVPRGMRAITIPIDPIKGLAGLLRPGDHVDVIAAPPRGPGQPSAYAIVRDARVLAVGNATSVAPPAPAASPGAAPTPQGPLPSSATLSVTPEQADLITSADLNGTLRLALRSPNEPADSLPPQDLIYPTPVPPTPPPTGVSVINGSTVEQVKP